MAGYNTELYWTSFTAVMPLPKYNIVRNHIQDDNFKFDENGRKLSKWVVNSVGKGEIARYEQFLLFQQCFQKACFPGASKGVIVWEWVNKDSWWIQTLLFVFMPLKDRDMLFYCCPSVYLSVQNLTLKLNIGCKFWMVSDRAFISYARNSLSFHISHLIPYGKTFSLMVRSSIKVTFSKNLTLKLNTGHIFTFGW